MPIVSPVSGHGIPVQRFIFCFQLARGVDKVVENFALLSQSKLLLRVRQYWRSVFMRYCGL